MKEVNKVLSRLISDLNEVLVVVEGKRDIAALSEIGVRWRVVSFEEFMRNPQLKDMRAVILTDFDRSGGLKAEILRSEMISRNIDIDDGLRIKFRRVFRTLTVEEVPYIFKKLMDGDYYG